MARPRLIPRRWDVTGFRVDREQVALATEVTCAVRDNPVDARMTLVGMGAEELAELALTLAAMVPDDRTAKELLGWVTAPVGVDKWRRELTPKETAKWHAAWNRGERGWAARHGNREWEARRGYGWRDHRREETA